MAKTKRKNKGFKRSKREWEESIAGHVGRAIDRVPIIDAILYSIAAYYGHVAAEKMGGKFPDTLAGSAIAMVSLKLATSRNLAAGTAGTAGLVGVGLATGIGQDILEGAHQVVKQIEDFWTHITGGGWAKEEERKKRYEAMVADCSAKFPSEHQMDQFVACVNEAQKTVWG